MRAARFRPRRHLFAPEVVQTSPMDCGPAALTCLLEGHGLSVSYGRLREACQTDVDGTSIDTLEAVAVQLGLQAEQVRERIFSAGIAGAGASARSVIDQLEADASAQYRPRGACRVKDLLERIDDCERRRKAAEGESDRFLALEEELEKWTARLTELARQEQDLQREQDLLDRRTYRRLRAEVQRDELQRRVGDAGSDVLDCFLRLLLVAHRHHNMRALARQLARGLQPETSIRARHDRYATALVRDIRSAPAHVVPSSSN